MNDRHCPHLNTMIVTSGGMHYSGGDVWDDIFERCICLECGQEIDPPSSVSQIREEPVGF